MNILHRIKLLLGIADTDTTKDALITELYGNITQAVLTYCELSTLPTELQFVVIEASVARYNRLGSEGLRSETVDVVRQDFISEVLSPYMSYLDTYKSSYNSVRFI